LNNIQEILKGDYSKQKNHRYQKNLFFLELIKKILKGILNEFKFFSPTAIDGTVIAGNDGGNISLGNKDSPFVVHEFAVYLKYKEKNSFLVNRKYLHVLRQK
jgi:hypothetical protein